MIPAPVARRFAWLGMLGAASACTEDLAAPGRCPDFCPGGQIAIVDTILATAIVRDSAYRGFAEAHQAALLVAADLPAVDSRPIFRTVSLPGRVQPVATDTTTVPITVDSARLALVITGRDTAATNLTLRLYRLPLTIDSATTFTGLAGFFADSLLRTVNVSSLLAQPTQRDPVTGDSVQVDSATRSVRVLVMLDTAQARYVVADTGKVAYGMRVSADSRASVRLAANEGAGGPIVFWFFSFDSVGTKINRGLARGASFDSYVFNPPPAPLDSTLAVGGAPAARSLLRVDVPRRLRDSIDVVRATLLLIPAAAAPGTPADSFLLAVHGVQADFGGKSPYATDSIRSATVWIHPGSMDTVTVELTRLFRFWSADSTAPATMVLRQVPEAASFAEIRFQPSTNPGLRPAVHLTYVRRFPFGQP